MLTGNQIASARRLAGIGTQLALATAAGVGRATIERAEAARDQVASMRTDQMAQVVRALESAGIEFTLEPGRTLAGGVSFRRWG